MGPFRPNFPKMTSSSENRREIFGKASARQGRKKAGRRGWGMARKKEGGVGRWVGDDIIKKIKNKK